MDSIKAYEVIEHWEDSTRDARNSGCNAVGMFQEDMQELVQAYSVVSVRMRNASPYAKIKELNGIEIFLQQVTDLPMNGRV